MEAIDPTTITFLEDVPQALSERDELSHLNLANRIVHTLQECPTPFTIGLSGEWGSGKTSVARHVQSQLENTPARSVPVVYFDAWKYQHDSLRRQFLIETHRQLRDVHRLSNSDLTRAELYETRSFQHTPEIDWKAVLPWASQRPQAAWLRLAFFCLSLFAIILALATPWALATKVVTAVIGGTAIQAILIALPRFLVTGIPTDVLPPITSAEQFGNKFQAWLKQGKLKDSRLVIIVDNVDRCDDLQIAELLGDIKTFLEPEGSKVIFLLPIDEIAIRRVLTERYRNSDAAGEFLRKFFNTLFRIPVPLAGETRQFTKAKLAQTGLLRASLATEEESGKVITVVMAAYRNNPRRVIQFLNRLSAQWLFLASTAEQLRRTDITSDLGAIAKAVAIKERWPELATFLEDSPLELAKLEKLAIAGDENYRIAGPTLETTTPEYNQFPGLAAFLRATQTIALPRPRLYLTGKADRFEIELPDAELLRSFLIGEQAEDSSISELIGREDWQEAAKAGHVSDFIKQELEDNWRSQQLEAVGILLSVVGPALVAIPQEFRTDLADSLGDRLGVSIDALAHLNPDAIIPIAEYSSRSKQLVLSHTPQLLSQIEEDNRVVFAGSLARQSALLSPIRRTLLDQKAVREDPVVLSNLVLIDGEPTDLWDPSVVLNTCKAVAESSDEKALSRNLPAARLLLLSAGNAGVDVHENVLKILGNESDPNPEFTFDWAASSKGLWASTVGEEANTIGDEQDLEPLRGRGQRIRENGDSFTLVKYIALMNRLSPFGSASSKGVTTMETEAWLTTVPLDPSSELGEWFP